MAAQLLHDLVDDQLGVALDIEASDTQLDGDAQVVDERLIFGHIIGGGEMDADQVPHATSRCEMKTSPASAPFFISNPSKYIGQYSSSTTAGNIWTSVHSAMKSASTWDLMAIWETSWFWMTSPRGKDVTTVTGCDLK